MASVVWPAKWRRIADARRDSPIPSASVLPLPARAQADRVGTVASRSRPGRGSRLALARVSAPSRRARHGRPPPHRQKLLIGRQEQRNDLSGRPGYVLACDGRSIHAPPLRWRSSTGAPRSPRFPAAMDGSIWLARPRWSRGGRRTKVRVGPVWTVGPAVHRGPRSVPFDPQVAEESRRRSLRAIPVRQGRNNQVGPHRLDSEVSNAPMTGNVPASAARSPTSASQAIVHHGAAGDVASRRKATSRATTRSAHDCHRAR